MRKDTQMSEEPWQKECTCGHFGDDHTQFGCDNCFCDKFKEEMKAMNVPLEGCGCQGGKWIDEEMYHQHPLCCEGDGGGFNVADDPCWGCIRWAFGELKEPLHLNAGKLLEAARLGEATLWKLAQDNPSYAPFEEARKKIQTAIARAEGGE